MRAGRRPARRRRGLGRGLRPAGHRQPGGAARRGRARGPGGWAARWWRPGSAGRARWCRIPAPGGWWTPLDPGRDRVGDPRRARRSARSRGLPARRRAPRARRGRPAGWPRSSRAPSPRTGRPPPGSRARPDGCATLRGRWRRSQAPAAATPPAAPRPLGPAVLAVAIGAVAAGAIAVWQPLLGLGAGAWSCWSRPCCATCRCGAWRRSLVVLTALAAIAGPEPGRAAGARGVPVPHPDRAAGPRAGGLPADGRPARAAGRPAASRRDPRACGSSGRCSRSAGPTTSWRRSAGPASWR